VEKDYGRYFLLKAASEFDLKDSMEAGVWGVRSGHEIGLMAGWNQSNNLYLILSVHRRKRFWGVAKLVQLFFIVHARI